jgi:hypothetical protein
MSTRQNLRSVGIKSAVVDVDAERDQTSEREVLHRSLYRSVGEEEGHADQSADDHGVLAAKLGVAHEASNNGTWDTADVGQSVVAPDFEL